MSHHPPPQISVTIVTFNSAPFIPSCLESLLQQTGVRFDVTVVDNASHDDTRRILLRWKDKIRTVWNDRNVGFAAAQNQAISNTTGEWVLALNPDVVMQPGFLSELYEAAQSAPGIGTVCGKLLALGEDLKVPERRLLDSCGMYFTPSMRHFDRGWHEIDEGQFDDAEYVFGASAAAALYRRSMIEDVSDQDGNFFDPDFFAYREDADVSWRAQLLGWSCLYTPAAIAYHVRRVTPGSRRVIPAVLNMHSVKNRFLMRIKNTTSGLFSRYWQAMLWRDALVIGGCLCLEPRSLPAFWKVIAALPDTLARRRNLLERRRISDEALARWFHTEPIAEPVVAVPRAVAAQQLSA